jgi:putative membrane protein insertion efficiency factor
MTPPTHQKAEGETHPKPSLAARAARSVVRGYQWVASPALHLIAGPGAGCRFFPSCSEYSIEALTVHGFFRGSWLTAGRLCRCGPWSRGGVDPVPAPAPARGARGNEE